MHCFALRSLFQPEEDVDATELALATSSNLRTVVVPAFIELASSSASPLYSEELLLSMISRVVSQLENVWYYKTSSKISPMI